MTPSIIRRFAKYHGVKIAAAEDTDERLTSGSFLCYLTHSCGPGDVLKLVQLLTRIEAAHHMYLRSKVARSSSYDAGYRDALRDEAEQLFRDAGIDPVRWYDIISCAKDGGT